MSELSSINEHINSQLRVASSVSQVSFISAKLVYPDASSKSINDVSSFVVPLYPAENVSSFNAAVHLSFRVNGVSKEAALTSLAITQDPYIPPNNACGCRLASECNS